MIYHKWAKKATKFNFFALLIFVLTPLYTSAQEFNCEVTINDEQLEGASFDYIQSLKPALENYINEYEWTDVEFEEEERIECQVRIILNSANQNFDYGAEVIFSAQRPIYNTTASTTTILLNDSNWQFNYPEGRSLIHDELQFEALTGFIDFYCLMMLGYDFDSFAELGGQDYFVEAQNILNLAQSTSAVGWTRTTNNRRNRFTLVTNMLSPTYEALRSAFYRYHRLGLDQFVNNPERARSEIITALENIRDAKRRSTSNYLYDVLFDTKSREIAAIFEEADNDVRLEAYNVLQDTDQGHLSDYEKLQN